MILANNHQQEMFPALEKLLADFQREGLPKWKQMKCIELAMALLAEDFIGNGIVIDIENGNIEWPMGEHTEPPTNEGNKRKGGKSSTKNSTGPKAKPSNVFGHLVNNVQSVSASKAKFKLPTKEPAQSSSSSNMLPDFNASNYRNGGRGKVSKKQNEPAPTSGEDKSDDSNALSGGHVGLPARSKNSMYQQE